MPTKLKIKPPPAQTQQPAPLLKPVVYVPVIVLLLIGHRWVAVWSLDLFTWGDHLLAMPVRLPFIAWALAGLPAGAATGAVLLWRRYHLAWHWGALPPALVLLGFCTAGILAGPMPLKVPEITVTRPPAPATGNPPPPSGNLRKKHHHTHKPVPELPDQQDPGPSPVNRAWTLTTEVSVHARTDSVLLHYRTRQAHDGPWSNWQDRFLPSAGQFPLTAGDLVRAHAVEWYYEVAGIATRSAASPFRKDRCDGELQIDTY